MVNPAPKEEAEVAPNTEEVATALKEAAVPLVESGDVTVEQRDAAVDAVLDAGSGADASNQEREHQERQALNFQNLLGNDVQANDIKQALFDPDNSIMQLFVNVIAAFTGADPDEMMAKIQEGFEKDKPNKDAASDNKGDDPKVDNPEVAKDEPSKVEASEGDKPSTDIADDAAPEATSPEEDKGYVQGVGQGPVTFDVEIQPQGGLIADFDVGSMVFNGGGDAPSLFNNLSNPDASQISLVDPKVDISAAMDMVEPPKNENVIGGMNM